LFAAVVLAGGKAVEDCAANAPAFGSGGTWDKYNNNKGPGYGGGIGNSKQTTVGGAVVLYFS
jgi:hypothetical protein